jgi:hypothetical protein
MSEIFDTVLQLALPASGSSEVRKYLRSLPAEECAREFHLGPTVQLDDSPYLHLMRCIDAALDEADKPPVFFPSPEKPFKEPRDWGTLLQLVNEDYSDLMSKRVIQPDSPASYLLDRLDNARRKVGAPASLSALDDDTRSHVCTAIEAEANRCLAEKQANYPKTLNGKTLVIELARGGPVGAEKPLPPPLGYRHALSQLLPEILERAVVLYVWVTPEESRRRNDERAVAKDQGSGLHRHVPHEVMLHDFGCDDIDWLMANSGEPDSITIEAHGQEFSLPVGLFDNRVDKTSFLRNDKKAWKQAQSTALHDALKATLDRLYDRATKG